MENMRDQRTPSVMDGALLWRKMSSVSFMPRLTSYSVSLPRLNIPPAVSDTLQTMSDLPSGANAAASQTI